jgi:hypothetical protein
MKHIIETIQESENIQRNLKPEFYFKSDDFFQILTDAEQRKNIHATYKKEKGKRCIFFYNGKEELGYLRLKQTSI